MNIKNNINTEEMIEQLTHLTDADFAQLHYLMSILSKGHELSREAMLVAMHNARVYVVRNEDGKIIGTATLSIFHSPTGTKASVEDVVVDPAMQGKGLGRQLVSHIINETKGERPIALQLTSRPTREAANHLYKSLGFEQRETNVYKMKL